jgi:dTDP-4-amino-4,6-dideoxygalactose transaminase
MAHVNLETQLPVSEVSAVASPPLALPSDADQSGRDLGAEELALLREVIESGTLNCTRGTQVEAFEAAFADRYGVSHARAVSSGTAAIHAAIAAIDPEPGDEVITTPITDMGAIAPILYQQAIPIFADVDPVSLNVTPETVAARITARTRAVVATHLFGNPCDVIGIRRVADAHGIPVIEDCAQAYLATQHGCLVGTIGTIGAFSLQQGKHMTTGEGGVVITGDPALGRRMTLFSDKAWGYGDPDPDHYFLALNYRMTDLQGAVARAQLRKLDSVVARRRASAARLTDLVSDVPGLKLPAPLAGATEVYWKYPLIVDPEIVEGGADSLGAALKAAGISCVPRYIQKPAFLCRVFTERKTYGRSRCPYSCRVRDGGEDVVYDPAEYPGTMRGLERVVVLPWSEFYAEEHIQSIASVVRETVRQLSGDGAGR